MKIYGIGADTTNPFAPEQHLLERLAEHLPLSIVESIPADAQVLITTLTRKSGKALFSKMMPDEKLYKIMIVNELYRSTLPYLKLADLVVFTSEYQKRICEELLRLNDNSIVLPLPTGDFYPAIAGSACFVVIDTPFSKDKRVYIEERIATPFHTDVHAVASPLHTVVFCEHTADFESLQKIALSATPEVILYNGTAMTREAIQAVMKTCSQFQYFKSEMNFDDYEGHMARRNSGMVHELIVDSPLLADLKYLGIPQVRAENGITSYNFAHAELITYETWAAILRSRIESDYEASLSRKQGWLDNLPYDSLEDVTIVKGKPLSNRYIFSICFRNQEKKIGRCIDSILAQNRQFDFGIALVDDCSIDGSIEQILKHLENSDVDVCVVSNKNRNYAARNFYNVINLYTTNDESVIMELDGDDFLNGTTVLESLDKYYAAGALKTNGSYKMYPDGQEFMDEEAVKRNHDLMDYANPWNLDKCNAWLHLRTSKRKLLRAVEINHFLDRNTHSWLPDRHDAAIQPRVIELSEGKSVFVTEVIYNYDISGDNHDHDNSQWEEEYLKLFGHIDKIYHPLILAE